MPTCLGRSLSASNEKWLKMPYMGLGVSCIYGVACESTLCSRCHSTPNSGNGFCVWNPTTIDLLHWTLMDKICAVHNDITQGNFMAPEADGWALCMYAILFIFALYCAYRRRIYHMWLPLSQTKRISTFRILKNGRRFAWNVDEYATLGRESTVKHGKGSLHTYLLSSLVYAF